MTNVSAFGMAPPVFLYGALRSGTTLVRLMLISHPGIDSPGEADFLFDFIATDREHPTGWRYDLPALWAERIFRDKGLELPKDDDGRGLLDAMVAGMAAKTDGLMVLNVHRHAPKMAALFPDAKVIHLLRDPRDVARSAVGMGWAGNSYVGIDHWLGTERDWDAAGIAEERVLTLRFEELIADIEGQLGRVCAFLGVPYDARMLSFHEATSYGPPDARIAEQWRRKAGRREVARIEAMATPILQARGYEPSGDPVHPGALEHALLMVQHRLKRWHFNIRRYGLGLFLAHHAARLLRLKGVGARLARRREAVQVEHLK